jgi:hypothetical protein
MQSAVIVLLKLLLATVTANSNTNNGAGAPDSGNGTSCNSSCAARLVDDVCESCFTPAPWPIEEPVELRLEDTDINRHREITSKAVSAILILTLKWFKTSRESRFPTRVLKSGGAGC